jgi:hypothetical protein
MPNYMVAAADRLVAELDSLLTDARITFQREPDTTSTHDKHTFVITRYTCTQDRGEVDVGIEKRQGRNGVYIVLQPSRRTWLWKNPDSERLCDRIKNLLCENGASASPRAECEDMR